MSHFVASSGGVRIMAIERVGQFIEFVADEGGTRTLARVTAIQIVAESDPLGTETFVTVANRTFRVGATLDEMRTALVGDDRPTSSRSRRLGIEEARR